MLKYLITIFVLLSISVASQISITANSFEANEEKKITTFIKNVHIKKDNDSIKSDKAIVIFDEKNTPQKYETIGNVEFSLSLKNSTITGSCQKLSYVPKSKTYILLGKVKIDEYPTKRKIEANKVIIDTINNHINITGKDKKPVKFIFTIKEEK